MPMAGQRLDPKKLASSMSVEQLNETAEQYFRSIKDRTYHLAKPFASAREAPAHLLNLGLLLEGMELGPGLRVLDFGAGSCWLSRLLNEMKCASISCDVSPTALQIGRELFE